MEKMPEISIIVPVYNPGREKLIRCLNSIADQTFADYEVILVDDGSSDGSSGLCDEFCDCDKRFIVVHQENAGVSSARNRGLAESKGKYICFIDSDDYVRKEYLETLISLIRKEKADLAICGVEILTEKELLLFTQQRSEESFVVNDNDTAALAELLDNRYFNYVYAKLYLGETIRKHNLQFNVEYSLGEDTLFVMEYLRHAHHIVISGHVLYTYMKYGMGTLTSVRRAEKYIKLMYVNRCIEEIVIGKYIAGGEDPSLLLRKIDERQLMCAEWAIECAEQQQTWSERVEKTKCVLNSNELKRAVERSGKEILGVNMSLLYKTKSAEIILLKRQAQRAWQRYSGIILRKIRAVYKLVRRRWQM